MLASYYINNWGLNIPSDEFTSDYRLNDYRILNRVVLAIHDHLNISFNNNDAVIDFYFSDKVKNKFYHNIALLYVKSITTEQISDNDNSYHCSQFLALLLESNKETLLQSQAFAKWIRKNNFVAGVFGLPTDKLNTLLLGRNWNGKGLNYWLEAKYIDMLIKYNRTQALEYLSRKDKSGSSLLVRLCSLGRLDLMKLYFQDKKFPLSFGYTHMKFESLECIEFLIEVATNKDKVLTWIYGGDISLDIMTKLLDKRIPLLRHADYLITYRGHYSFVSPILHRNDCFTKSPITMNKVKLLLNYYSGYDIILTFIRQINLKSLKLCLGDRPIPRNIINYILNNGNSELIIYLVHGKPLSEFTWYLGNKALPHIIKWCKWDVSNELIRYLAYVLAKLRYLYNDNSNTLLEIARCNPNITSKQYSYLFKVAICKGDGFRSLDIKSLNNKKLRSIRLTNRVAIEIVLSLLSDDQLIDKLEFPLKDRWKKVSTHISLKDYIYISKGMPPSSTVHLNSVYNMDEIYRITHMWMNMDNIVTITGGISKIVEGRILLNESTINSFTVHQKHNLFLLATNNDKYQYLSTKLLPS